MQPALKKIYVMTAGGETFFSPNFSSPYSPSMSHGLALGTGSHPLSERPPGLPSQELLM